MNDRVQRLLLTAGGLGHLRPASGTWGSTPPVVLAAALLWVDLPAWMISICLVLVAAAFSIACVRFGDAAERIWGRKDPGQVVADEVAGQCVALLLLPWRRPDAPDAWTWNLTLLAAAFVLFRIMDIIKPPPARGLQRLRSGWGILVDDLVAGLYALILVQVFAWFVLPSLV